jgi:pyruvate/2-oxoglutarate dehydrogenase complex dihydrolipoamide acyltransferase (E2) component
MKCDCFTISRYVFLIFLVIVAVYFLIENKSVPKKIEGFAEEAAAASKPTASSPAPTTAKSPAPAPAAPKAPEGASKEGLSNKKANDTAIAGKDPTVFLSKDPKTMEAEVVKIYQELYKVNPQAEEVGFYIDYAKTRDITRAALKEVISTSAPTLKKTLMKNKQVNDGLMDLVGTEKDVISVFNEILQRNPDREELFQFSRMLKTNEGGFNQDKLRQVLLTSEEYQRMERTQTNTAYVSLQGDITERQVTMIVYKLHKEVTGKEFIDEDTLRFLKRKFVEFKLDEVHMKKFIENYVAGKPAPPAPAATADAAAKEAAAKKAAEEAANAKKAAEEAANAKKAEEAAAAAKVPGAKETSKDAKETFGQVATLPGDGKNYITNSIFILGGTDRPNGDLLTSLSKSAGTGNSVDTNKVIQTIKDSASVAADRNAAKSQSQVQLSKFIEERNRAEMQSVCQRNTYFRDLDENSEPASHSGREEMVLRPELKWSVPQRHPPICMGNNSSFSPLMTQSALIGTPLDEAAETKVGSILPKNPPV